MKINLPVTQTEKSYPKGKYLVSKTDLKGVITYANEDFVELSGFSNEELIGKSHNLVRHPDMPPQAFEDLWKTVKEGRPWRGIVKNRTKNGDYYWVDAFVVPVRKNDQTLGYMSVRSEPSRQQIQDAEQAYKQLNSSKTKLDTRGSWWQRLSVKARMASMMGGGKPVSSWIDMDSRRNRRIYFDVAYADIRRFFPAASYGDEAGK